MAETLSSIRTVASFRGEALFSDRYRTKLEKAKKSALRAGVSAAAGGAGMMASMFLMYNLSPVFFYDPLCFPLGRVLFFIIIKSLCSSFVSPFFFLFGGMGWAFGTALK